MGGNIRVPQILEPIVCPNPNCRKKIEELIIVSNKSAMPQEQYYACPYCYMKLDWISTTLEREKREKKVGEKGPSRCPNHFGYLAVRVLLRGEDVPIPRECLACPKALDCVMKTSDS
jgi:hypothetical protein